MPKPFKGEYGQSNPVAYRTLLGHHYTDPSSDRLANSVDIEHFPEIEPRSAVGMLARKLGLLPKTEE